MHMGFNRVCMWEKCCVHSPIFYENIWIKLRNNKTYKMMRETINTNQPTTTKKTALLNLRVCYCYCCIHSCVRVQSHHIENSKH